MAAKIFRTAVMLCLAVGICGCSKPKAAYKNAGLKVTAGGRKVWTCGFFYRTTEGKMLPHASEMGSSGDDHKIKVVWSVRPEAAGDVYRLKMNVDGVNSEHDVTYSGTPVVVMERPLRVVVEEMPP